MEQEQRALPVTEDLFCPRCGYNLRGGVSGRCPECGEAYRPEELSASRIPWTSRGRLGRARAWWRTVMTATFRTGLIADSLQAELPRGEARWFWLTCLLPLWAGVWVLLVAARLGDFSWGLLGWLSGSPPIHSWPLQLIYPWHVAVRSWVVVAGMGLAATASLMLLPVRIAAFCRYPASLRERAITAAHYLVGAAVGGAIAGLGVAAVAWGVIVAMSGRGRIGEALLVTLVAFTPVMAMLLWMIAIYRFHRRTTLPAGTAAPPFWLVFPLLAGLSLGVWLLLVPWVIGLLWLIVSTLRG